MEIMSNGNNVKVLNIEYETMSKTLIIYILLNASLATKDFLKPPFFSLSNELCAVYNGSLYM